MVFGFFCGVSRCEVGSLKPSGTAWGLLSLSIAALAAPSFLYWQTPGPQKQAFLKRKGELLTEIQAYDQKKAEAQTTLSKQVPCGTWPNDNV